VFQTAGFQAAGFQAAGFQGLAAEITEMEADRSEAERCSQAVLSAMVNRVQARATLTGMYSHSEWLLAEDPERR
jgi:hypothetical protein